MRFEGAGCRKGFYVESFLASIEGIVLSRFDTEHHMFLYLERASGERESSVQSLVGLKYGSG